MFSKFGIPNFPQSPDIEQNSDGGISDIRIYGHSIIKENCHNSRTSDDVDMKFGLVAKLDKRNNLMVMSCQKIVMLLLFFQFIANLEQSRSWIPDA